MLELKLSTVFGIAAVVATSGIMLCLLVVFSHAAARMGGDVTPNSGELPPFRIHCVRFLATRNGDTTARRHVHTNVFRVTGSEQLSDTPRPTPRNGGNPAVEDSDPMHCCEPGGGRRLAER